MAVRLLGRWLAALCLLAAGVAGAAAEEFRTPSITAVRVEWRAVLDQLRTEIATQPGDRFPIYVRRPAARAGMGSARDARAGATERDQRKPVRRDRTQPGAGAVAVRYRRLPRRPGRRHAQLPLSRYQADFSRADLFHAGPAGYDAVFSLPPGAAPAAARTFARPVEVQITGSILVYDLADPLGGRGEPVKALAAQFPDMRRFIREGYVRYAFTRFGVPYVVSIQCLDSAPRARRLACREAYPIAERFLKALRIAGGQPARPRHDISSEIAERPAAASPDFTYRPGGDIIARSGVRRRGGRADFAAYSQIRFPLEKAPAAIRSQSFGKKTRRAAAASIRGGTIFAKPAASRSGNAPPASAIRARTSVPRPARRTATAKAVAIRGSRPSWPSATAS